MKAISELIKTLTLEEKASLCQGADFWNTVAVPEKGVPAVRMSDGPHGVRKQTGETDHMGMNPSVPATCFPTAASIACSWDEELIYRIGQALGEECRQEGIDILLGPGANMKRSPLCGRNFEYFSEDPCLSSKMAKNYILGVQSQGVGTSLKHFAVNNQETRRMSVNAVVDERALREIYLASFEEAVREAKPWTIMAAYNKVNGAYCCENEHLLRDILRDEWGYEGVVVSDWGAANDQAAGIPAGFDLRMPFSGKRYIDELVAAVKSGRLDEALLDRTVERILTLVKKGLDGRKEGVRYDVQAHHALAVDAACESAVLVRNDGTLPLKKSAQIALIGRLARHMRYQGGGSSHIEPTILQNLPTVLDSQYPDVRYAYAPGYSLKRDGEDPEAAAEAVELAGKSDVIVYCMGLPYGWESEGADRTHMGIPANQVSLLKELHETGKKIVVLFFAGAPVEMPWIDCADAVLLLYTAGQGAAEAAVKLLFGEKNPCGKLAETWPLKLSHTPCALNYPQGETAVYEEGVYIGYRYYQKKELEPLFPFGYGLSYTTWKYENLTVSAPQFNGDSGDTLRVTVDVTNTGKLAGKEIVQLYIAPKAPKVSRPIRELRGFGKVFCQPGETKTLTFTLNKRSFAYYETRISDWYAESGEYEIEIGASAEDIRASATVRVESRPLPRTYDRYSTAGDMMESPVGQKIAAEMMASMMPQMPAEEKPAAGEDDIEDAPMEIGAMSMAMPLIKISDMTAGVLPVEAVDAIVARLNGGEE